MNAWCRWLGVQWLGEGGEGEGEKLSQEATMGGISCSGIGRDGGKAVVGAAVRRGKKRRL